MTQTTESHSEPQAPNVLATLLHMEGIHKIGPIIIESRRAFWQPNLGQEVPTDVLQKKIINKEGQCLANRSACLPMFAKGYKLQQLRCIYIYLFTYVCTYKYRKYHKSPSNLRLGAEGSQHDLRHRWILLLDGRPPGGRSSADERSRGQQRVPWPLEDAGKTRKDTAPHWIIVDHSGSMFVKSDILGYA